MAATDFAGFLMPTSFLRRWRYDELIPALLYFDRVTFLMDDIEGRYLSDDERYQTPEQPSVRLHSPIELEGVPNDTFVDGLMAEQHRYYWPLRDLMREHVIVITSMDMSFPTLEAMEELARFEQALRDHQHPQHRIAVDYQSSAVQYFDKMADGSSDISTDKARAVYAWIYDALCRERDGWQRVMLQPSAFVAFQKALELFPSLYAIHARNRFNRGPGPSTGESLIASKITADLLEAHLPTYALDDDDPTALAEILTVRERHRSDLGAFRASMMEATNQLQLEQIDADELVLRVNQYVRRLRPVFADTAQAMSDKRRVPKLVLRKTGAVVAASLLVGLGAAAGAMLAGPAGVIAGGAAGETVRQAVIKAAGAGAKDSVTRLFTGAGDAAAATIGAHSGTADPSLAYLFYADQALRRGSLR